MIIKLRKAVNNSQEKSTQKKTLPDLKLGPSAKVPMKPCPLKPTEIHSIREM